MSEKPFLSTNSVTRRGFLATGLAAYSTATLGNVLAEPVSPDAIAAANLLPIDPGYVSSLYYDDKEKDALNDVLKEGSPFRFWGPGTPVKTKHFEEAFAQYMGVPYALAVTSGTAALDCAMAGLGVGPGDEVIVPAYSWWSDYTCVLCAGALPVFADIDETFNLDPRDFERKITPRTKAVLAVHLMGGPCDLDPILDIARKHNIAVLEDAAQAVGGSYKGKKLGTLGDVGIYSFQINKMISSGEGGAVVTSNPMIYERAVRYHDVGIFREIFEKRTGSVLSSSEGGQNFRLNEFTGGVLDAQLTKLDTMIQDQRRNAQAIAEGIQDLPGLHWRKQPDPDGDIGYAVSFAMKNKEARDRCIKELRKWNVPAATLIGSVLLPIQESVIKKQARHPNWPSFNSPEGKAIQYGPECCRQTLDVFDRFVLIRVGPKYTDAINQQIITAVREVYPKVA
ncbi:MAG TPA: DegT/DnrJ/EryC1/StrS family aminotransferase [bacterium]|nr:DegT/DnrJ/EryC1/StrS family aminotransferase [Candidatus Omnitrophota bacterium]HOL92902.1 DegT/DnrJ/EryC1/StrS family aminotransferase [bacterium]HPO99964.1 DegT/DnrJ/EryC1/StrS family aminotransferase [bacterium]HXK92540.1 DegT/DnrJ/EryC1/StrS family aminotransferase [bacterium]